MLLAVLISMVCVAGQEGQAIPSGRSASGAMLAAPSRALSGGASPSLAPPVPIPAGPGPLGPSMMLPASFGPAHAAAGVASGPTHRLSAVSGPAHAGSRSGYWNLSPGVHVPSVQVPDTSRAGLASLVATRPANPGPTISSGGESGKQQPVHCLLRAV